MCWLVLEDTALSEDLSPQHNFIESNKQINKEEMPNKQPSEIFQKF